MINFPTEISLHWREHHLICVTFHKFLLFYVKCSESENAGDEPFMVIYASYDDFKDFLGIKMYLYTNEVSEFLVEGVF
jgi:hypothetical protein